MRIISLLLALMVIAGCSGTGSNESAEPPEASVTSEAAAQSTAPQASPADATADFTGKYRKSPRRFRINIQASYIWMPFS